jgi:hypothetical protein
MRIGQSSSAHNLDGLAELLVMNTAIDATTAGYYRAYAMTRYNL